MGNICQYGLTCGDGDSRHFVRNKGALHIYRIVLNLFCLVSNESKTYILLAAGLVSISLIRHVAKIRQYTHFLARFKTKLDSFGWCQTFVMEL